MATIKRGLSQKENEEELRPKKTISRNIIREVKEEQWEHDGFCGNGHKRRKTYRCLICRGGGIRSDNRRVHSCI